MTRSAQTKKPADAEARRRVKPVLVYSVDGLPPFDAAFYEAARAGMTKISELTVPPREARAFNVPAGHFFRIVSIEGPQVGDLNLWNASDLSERFFSGKTRAFHATHVSTGDRLWSTLPSLRPMATITHDTLDWYGWDEDGGGVHDIIGTRCDPYTNLLLKGVEYHHCCHSNLTRALAEARKMSPVEAELHIHDVMNVFMCTGYTRDTHQYFMKASPVRPGRRLRLEPFRRSRQMLPAQGGDLSAQGGRARHMAPARRERLFAQPRLGERRRLTPRAEDVQPRPRPPASARRRLGRHTDVFVLMQHVVVGVFRILLDLEDADHLVQHVAVLVEGDLALQRVEVGVLDGVPDIRAVHRLAARRDALDRVDDDLGRIIGGDGVVVRLGVVALHEARDPALHLGLVEHVGRSDRRIPPLRRREAGTLEQIGADHPVAAALDHLRDDVIGLLHELHAGLRNPAVIERVGMERLDLGEDGRVVGLLRVELVMAQHLDADLLRLRLEGVRESDAIGPGIVEDVDRLHVEHVFVVVGHVRALIG